MSENLDKIAEVFLSEANDLLDKLEEYLLELEQNPDDMENISAVFRSMHTIKGSAGMFGFDAISRFTHEAETTFDEVRNGRVAVSSELITLTLQARDHIREMLDNKDNPSIAAESERLIQAFQVYLLKHDKTNKSQADTEQHIPAATEKNETKEKIESKEAAPKKEESKEKEQKAQKTEEEEAPEITWRIKLEFSPDVLENGTRPNALISELAEMGAISISPHFDGVPRLHDLNPVKCYLSWDVILTTTRSEEDIKDVFIFLDDTSKITITKLTDPDQDSSGKKLGEILIDKKLATQEDINNALGGQKPLGTLLAEKKIVSKEDVNAALAEQRHLKEQNEKKNQELNAQTIKVNSSKLDKLIDLVGELVTFNARLNQVASTVASQQLSTLGEQGERLILELRDTTMDMRMLPIGTIFSRFRRLVRDLASGTGKSIELITEGAETELDKTVIEKLNDPLVHLIRNSCDHGIELPEARIEKGKEPAGKVQLRAQHAGAFVLITISDDGAGLNREKIKQKAIDNGIIGASEELTENEIDNLIFMPGFSTAEKVTSISGRGVGMDVVKKDITSLGGSVSIQSVPGKGTTFTLKIPLTLAIIEGILVQLGDNFYILPLSNVVECLEFEQPVKKNTFCSSMKVRDEMMPYIDLRSFFEIEGERPDIQQMVIVTDQDSRIGLIIDRVIGNYQTVIKPLGRLYQNVSGLSGATILGDGSVALILDVYKLSDIVRKLDTNS
ncbi:MAG: chemotaxis protein CheA [Treponemataceae bacterium]|nr:chemotaxis protein CheA [Treponemataceae bacterium]